MWYLNAVLLLFSYVAKANLLQKVLFFPILCYVTNFLVASFAALDMCTTNCSHFLHCESRQRLYHCECQVGFSGPHCDINIDDCSSSPCINGKCLDGVNRYECECNKGFWGTNCEKKINNERGWRLMLRAPIVFVVY